MKKCCFVILLFCLLYALTESESQGQLWKMKRYEATVAIGPSFFFGDIGGFSKTKNIIGFRDMTIKQTRFDFNFNLKYRITSDINARLSLTYGFLHATDVRGSNEGRAF